MGVRTKLSRLLIGFMALEIPSAWQLVPVGVSQSMAPAWVILR
jgi:hypothetical protein